MRVDEGAILSVGNYYYLLSDTYSTDHDCTDTTWHSGVYTDYNYCVLKLDNAGNVLWNKSYGGSSIEHLHAALFDDRDSTILMMGTAYSNDYMVTDSHGYGDICG